jgi:hypothetical protein
VLVPIDRLPRALTPLQAVEAAYEPELDELAGVARRDETALVECDQDLAPHVLRALRARVEDPARGAPLRLRPVTGAEPERRPLGGGAFELELLDGARAGACYAELVRLLRAGDPRLLVVVAGVEALATCDEGGAPSGDAHELARLLADHPGVPVLALHAPEALVPDVVARAFRRRGGLGPVGLERLGRLVLRSEARKLATTTLDLAPLHEALDGLNALEVRAALARLERHLDHDPRAPRAPATLLAELCALPRRARAPRPVAPDPGPAGLELRLRRR